MLTLLDEKSPEKGLLLAYMGGSLCSGSETPSLNGLPRKTVFRLECGDVEDKSFTLNEPGETQGTTKCELHFKIKTPVACPWFVSNLSNQHHGKGVMFYTLILLGLFLTYNIMGIIYN